MTAAQIEEYFDLLTDKVGSPYFTQSEKSNFLNRAQIEYVNRTIPSNEGGIVNLEMNQDVMGNVYTLIYETASLTSNSSGEILKTAVQSALNAASSATEPFMKIMNVSYSGYPVKYTPHNDWYAVENNSFKAGTSTSPKYRQLANKFIFSPINTSTPIKFTLLKYPKDINLATLVTSELPDQTHKTIVEIGVELASISMRDTELTQANQIQQ
jgi:hypothetical protein